MRHLWAVALCIAVLWGGCAEEFSGRPPLQGEFHYPIGITVDQAENKLLVFNSNFDLAYESASLVTVNLDDHSFSDAWLAMGSFPGDIVFVSGDDGSARGYFTVRGNDSITWFSAGQADGSYTLFCNDSNDPGLHKCTGTHVVSEGVIPDEDELDGKLEVDLGSEPTTLALIPGTGDVPDRLVSGALSDGAVTLMDFDEAGAPVVVDQYSAIQGINHVAVDPFHSHIYVSNRFFSLLYRLQVEEGPEGPALDLMSTVSLPGPLSTANYGRGLAFAGQGRYVLLAYRTPAAVLVLDTVDDAEAFSQNTLALISVGGGPSRIRVLPTGPGGKELAYVTCFDDDKVWVLDLADLVVVDQIDVGAGPYDLAARLSDTEPRAYVSNFLDDTISVIDLDPTSPYYHTQIAEIH